MTRLRADLAKPVLCGVDFSRHSRPALRHAAIVATRLKRPLTVLFVNDPLLAAAAEYEYDRRAVDAQTLDELQRFVRRALGRMFPGHIEYVVTTGQPARALADTGARLEATLVVIGTHGLGGVQALLFGSTAVQLVTTSNVPVLVVPSNRRRRPPEEWPGPQIAMAVDSGNDVEAAADFAAEFAHQLDVELVLFHMPLPAAKTRWFMPRHSESQTIDADNVEAQRVRIPDFVAGRIEPEVLSGDTVEAIGAFLRRRQIGLLMLTRRLATSLSQAHRAVLYEILGKASTPVLVLAPPCSVSGEVRTAS